MIGNHDDVRLATQAALVQFVQHSRQISVRTLERRLSGFGAWTEIVLREVRFAQPKQREFGNTVLPKRADQCAGRPLVAPRVRMVVFRVRSEGLNQFGPRVCGQCFVGVKNFSGTVMLVPPFAVVEQSDPLGAGNGGLATTVLQNLCDGGQLQVTPIGQPIACPHGFERFRADGFQHVDSRAVLLVRHDAALRGISAGGQRCAVDFRRAQVNRVMISKENALLSEFVKCGCVLFSDEIRPHSVPDDHDDVLGLAGCKSGG